MPSLASSFGRSIARREETHLSRTLQGPGEVHPTREKGGEGKELWRVIYTLLMRLVKKTSSPYRRVRIANPCSNLYGPYD